jgi:hypothetical protein
MVMEGDTTMGILNHEVVDLIDTSFEGFYQSTTSDNGIELHGNAGLTEFIEYQLTTKVLLFYHIIETCKFLWGMYDVTDQHRRLVLEDSHLRGGGTRINHKDLHGSE